MTAITAVAAKARPPNLFQRTKRAQGKDRVEVDEAVVCEIEIG